MGVISGTVDAAALSRLARGENAVRLGALLDDVDGACVQLGYGRPVELPVPLRAYDPPDDDDSDDDCGYVAYAGTARAVAIAHREVRPDRWVYLGKGSEPVRGSYRAVLFTTDNVREWGDPWQEHAIGAAASNHVRLVQWSGREHVKAVLLDGGDTAVALYLGFDTTGEAVALVLDACELGGIHDDRVGDELLHATQHALAGVAAGPLAIAARHRFEVFMPNLAAGVPRFEDDAFFTATREVTATCIGTLPLPTRTIALRAGRVTHNRWPTCADAFAVFTFVDAHDRVAAWMLRADGARPVRWEYLGFAEDNCSIGDAGGTEDARLEVVDGGWPRGTVGFAMSETGATVVCVTGPDLTQASCALGFDADDRLTTLVTVG